MAKKGLLLVYTGNGKGKTTASLGGDLAGNRTRHECSLPAIYQIA